MCTACPLSKVVGSDSVTKSDSLVTEAELLGSTPAERSPTPAVLRHACHRNRSCNGRYARLSVIAHAAGWIHIPHQVGKAEGPSPLLSWFAPELLSTRRSGLLATSMRSPVTGVRSVSWQSAPNGVRCHQPGQQGHRSRRR